MNHYLKRVTLVALISVFTFSSYAQYGNDWINYNQQHLKVKISEEGVYRIDQGTFTSLGAKLISLNPKNIKVYRHGEEQYVYVKGEADNSFDATDYIEFYATGNDGKLDTRLFGSAEAQGHNRLSLYENEAVYFITWGAAASSKHITDYYDGNYAGKAADDFYMHTSWATPQEDFYNGSPFSFPAFHSSYTEGEGFYSDYFSGTKEVELSIATDNYVSSGPNPTYEIYAGGKSSPQTSVGDKNQEMQVRAIKNGTVLHNKQFVNYENFTLSGTLSSNEIETTNTRFGFSSVLGDRGRQAVSYIKLIYPRSYSMNNEEDYLFNYISSETYLNIHDYALSNSAPYVIDFANGNRIKADLNTGSIEFNRSGNAKGNLFVYDSSDVRKLTVSEVSNAYINRIGTSQDPDFIIITHSDLANSAAEYKSYRESSVGGSHKVLVAYTSDIYDQFFYGQHHPLALKNFTNYLIKEQAQSPEYLMLLGKGYSYDHFYSVTSKTISEDLEPTYGLPASDILFTSEPELDDLAPRLATGRVPAKTNEDVLAYLAKVKEHELGNNESRKFLMLTGGSGEAEKSLFLNYQNQFYEKAQVKPFQAQKISIVKDSSSVVQRRFDIQDSINSGVAMVSYFGHSATEVLELDFGDVADFKNKGKYPLFLFNGSSVGNVYTQGSLTEDLLLTPEVGAVSVVAHTTFQFIDPTFIWTKEFMGNLFEDNYGEPIGKIMAQSISDYQSPSNNFNAAQSNQRNYFGDPVLSIYSPKTSLSVANLNSLETNIKVFPNPSNGIIHINAPEGTSVQVINPFGQIIKQTTESILDLSSAPSGIYLVQCSHENTLTTKRILLSH